MKRKILTLTGVAAAAAVLSTSAFADTASSTAAHVYVDVSPNVSSGVLTGNLALDSVQNGTNPTAHVGFTLDANQEQLWLAVQTTDLYKGDDPTSTYLLPVNQPLGATIQPVKGNPTTGASNVGVYGATAVPYDGFNAYMTNYIEFESGQNGDFSQAVYVDVGWINDNPEQPTGEYSGYVVLYSALSAPASP